MEAPLREPWTNSKLRHYLSQDGPYRLVATIGFRVGNQGFTGIQQLISPYESLLATIGAHYSVEADAPKDAKHQFVQFLAKNDSHHYRMWKMDLLRQFEQSMSASGFSWKDALWDEYLHAFEAASEADPSVHFYLARNPSIFS